MKPGDTVDTQIGLVLIAMLWQHGHRSEDTAFHLSRVEWENTLQGIGLIGRYKQDGSAIEIWAAPDAAIDKMENKLKGTNK